MSARRTIRVLMTADAVGGVWTYALDLATGLTEQGVEIVLVVMGPRASPDQCAAANRVKGLQLVETDLPLEWLADDASEVRRAGLALAALVRETEADIVHLNTPGIAAGVAFSAPLVVACHSCVASWWQAVRGGPVPAEFEWRRALTAEAYAAADLLVAPSETFAATTRNIYGLPEPPLVVRNARRPIAAGAIGVTPPFAFTAGRLWDEGKDAATLDRAAAEFSFPMFAAGPVTAPHGGRIELAHTQSLGRLSAVEIASWLAARPIFASAARYEPFGLTVLEAAQAGCALVLADTPVFRELWDGAASFARVGDARAFAAAICGFAGDTERRAAAGAAAEERARRYAPAVQARAMLDAYRRLLRASGRPMGRDAAA